MSDRTGHSICEIVRGLFNENNGINGQKEREQNVHEEERASRWRGSALLGSSIALDGGSSSKRQPAGSVSSQSFVTGFGGTRRWSKRKGPRRALANRFRVPETHRHRRTLGARARRGTTSQGRQTARLRNGRKRGAEARTHIHTHEIFFLQR